MQASLSAKSFLLEITMLTTTVSGGECSFRVVSMTPQKAELYLQRFGIFCSIFFLIEVLLIELKDAVILSVSKQ